MREIRLSVPVLIFVAVVAGTACAVVGAYIGYGHGYKKGDFDGRHEASRAAVSGVTDLMTGGVAIAKSDGTSETYLLKPVKAPSN